METIFVGDWHPLLRDPLDLVRLSFPVGALIFAVQGDWDAVVRLLIPGRWCCWSGRSTSRGRSTCCSASR